MDIYRDHRKLSLKNEEDKKYLDDYTQTYIDLSREEMQRTGYVDICNKIAMYVDGSPLPAGFSDDSLAELIRQNTQMFDMRKFQVKKDKQNVIFFSDNRIAEMERGYLAEFTRSKKTMKAEHDKNPKNDRLEWAMGKKAEQWERQKNIWMQVRQPAIRYMLRYQRGFTRPYFNAYKIKNIDDMGDITMEYYHPLSVLVDPFPTQKLLLNSRFIIPFKKVPLEEARLIFESMGKSRDSVIADTEADEIMSGGSVTSQTNINDQYVTIYYPEWRQFSLDSINLGIIAHDEYGNLNNRQLKALNGYCFEGIYNRALGMCYFSENKYTDPRDTDNYQFACGAYEDEQSDLSVLGMSRLGKALVIQDLLNVVLTLKLNSERQRQLIRGLINKKLSAAWGPQVLKDFMNIGTIAQVDFEELHLPDDFDIKKLITFLEMPDHSSGLSDLLVIIDNVIKRMTIRKEVLSGQLPTKSSEQMSGKLAQELKDSNSTLLQPIVQNIEWRAGNESNYIMKIWAEEFGEDEWVEITGGSKSDPKYIPIEGHWPSAKFYSYLSKAYPNMDLVEAGRKFAERSSVEIERRWKDPLTGRRYTPEEVEMNDIYHINSLKELDANGEQVGVHRFAYKVGLVFNADDTQYDDKVLAGQMFAKNPESIVLFEIFLEQQGGYWAENKDDIVEKYKNERDAMKRLEYIQSLGPEFWQAFQGFVQEWQIRQSAAKQQVQASGAQQNNMALQQA